jgi:hypothetical protein
MCPEHPTLLFYPVMPDYFTRQGESAATQWTCQGESAATQWTHQGESAATQSTHQGEIECCYSMG